jgi:DNA-binding LacI/PurR family transcriptional regulator
MYDVATAAGVAQSTVSRVLSGARLPIRVSSETRQRVIAIADELGYRPDPIARALRGAPTMLIGAVVRDITDWFFAPTIEALSLNAKDRGYSVVLGHAGAAADEALKLATVLEARHCDAILLLGDFRRERHLVEDLRNVRAHVVGLWQGAEGRGRPFPTVGVDNRAGVLAALEHVRAQGHRHIAFVGVDSLGDMKARRGAYLEYVEQGSALPSRDYVQLVPNTIDAAQGALAVLMKQKTRPTAIIAASDVLALGLIRAAYDRGLAIPGEMSIVGFDDIPQAAASVPGLTTVRMPIAEIIDNALDLAVGADAWNGEGVTPRNIFRPSLIVRQSTAPPPEGPSG